MTCSGGNEPPQPQSFARLKFSIRHFPENPREIPENRKQLAILSHPTCLGIRFVLFDLKVLFTYFIVDLLDIFYLVCGWEKNTEYNSLPQSILVVVVK